MTVPPNLPRPLDRERETRLAREIEAGLVAERVLAAAHRPNASPEELRRIIDDGRAAWQEFLSANLRLAVLLAGQAARRSGMEFDDLFQEACLSIGQALRRYDHTRGRFTTYALPLVSQHLRAVTSSLAGLLGLPAQRAVELRRAQAVADELSQELGRAAVVAEVSAALGRDPVWTARLLSHQPPVPLDWVADVVAEVAPELDGSERQAVFHRVLPDLARLPGDQREVLRLRFGFADGRCHSYREIAAGWGISATSVRRIEQRGLAALRDRHRYDGTLESAAG